MANISVSPNNRGIGGGEDWGSGRTGRSSASNVIGHFLPGWGARGGRPRGIASRFRVRRRGQFGKVDNQRQLSVTRNIVERIGI
jgi:hypothetical protein